MKLDSIYKSNRLKDKKKLENDLWTNPNLNVNDKTEIMLNSKIGKKQLRKNESSLNRNSKNELNSKSIMKTSTPRSKMISKERP